MEILRQSMPWGTMSEQGLYFISCCRTPLHFNAMLASMYKGRAVTSTTCCASPGR